MFTVTASHVSADYDSLIKQTTFAENTEYRVRGDETNGYYASGPLLGCGRTCRTPEAAIHDILAANGYTSIVIRSPEPEPEPTGKPLAKSLHTVTVLVRVAALHLDRIGDGDSHTRAALALELALDTLGLASMPDEYGLFGQALKQVTKIA